MGIRIPLEQNLEIIGQFAGATGTKKVPAPEPEREIEGQEQSIDQPAQANQPVQAERREDVLQNEEMQRQRSQKKSQGVQEPQPSKNPATENTLHMKDTKWEQLSSIYPHIHPFRDTREFLSVGPEDFVVLRERCYQMTHNSFLLHGYYNYRHLLLMRQEIPGEVKYYIGVPGNFYEREKQVARMFGFESFEGAREPAWEGDFGYYLISVEL